MKKNLLGLVAILFAVALVAFKSIPNEESSKRTNFYFKFMGTHGQEADESKWDNISSTDYSNLLCPGGSDGCKLITTSSTGTPLRPSVVNVNASNTPQLGSGVTEVINKN